MSYDTVLPIWNALREQFQKKISELSEEDIHMKLGETTIGSLLTHTAEVEYMFSEWFFDHSKPGTVTSPKNKQDYLQLLQDSNAHFCKAMENLPIDSWKTVKRSSFGDSTPLEAVGRLMNHTGMHSGQITFIKKHGSLPK